MRTVIVIILSLLILASNAYSSNLETLFYANTNQSDGLYSDKVLQNFKEHAKSINIIAPQVFSLDENGVISGKLDVKLIEIAKKNNIKILPLIVNANFDQEVVHRFLHNLSAQEKAISNIIALCEENKFYGIQFDFENVNVKDKAEFTRFYQLTANRLHQRNFIVSIAVIPRISDTPEDTDFGRWYFENWSGVYDYRALGQIGDFISLMSYDQHTTLTTPGPIAAFDWVEKSLQEILKVVPANKVSLGIATYSGYWTTGKVGTDIVPEKYNYRSKETPISYSKVLELLKDFNQSLMWHPQWKTSYLIYNHTGKNEYLFVENEKSFKEKLKLAKRYRLRGVSVWKLGTEDPEIWKHLK